MTSRETILARLREALRVTAPLPGHHQAARQPLPKDPAGFRQWLPKTGNTSAELSKLFAQNAAALKTDFKVLPDAQAAGQEIRRIATEGGWKAIATHRGPLTEELCRTAGASLLLTDSPYATADLERCDGGVSACEALVAQTGSVLISSRSCGGRALSVLPPHHLVVATAEQLLPDLSAAFELVRQKYDGDYPSTISFITGPSRTGDIERILVLGAHGPKKLTVLLIA